MYGIAPHAHGDDWTWSAMYGVAPYAHAWIKGPDAQLESAIIRMTTLAWARALLYYRERGSKRPLK